MTDNKKNETSATTSTLVDKLSVVKVNVLIVAVHVLSLAVCAAIVIGFIATNHFFLMTVWLIAFLMIQYGITFSSLKLRKLYLYGDVYRDSDIL